MFKIGFHCLNCESNTKSKYESVELMVVILQLWFVQMRRG